MMEMVVVVAVVGIVAAIAVPGLFRMSQRSALRASANTLVSALKLARTSAASGRASIPGWGANDRTLEAGVRFVSDTQYLVFVDRNRITDNDEGIVRTFDLVDDYPNFRLVGAPAEIRFQRNGMLTQPLNVDVLLRDQDTGHEYTVRATFGGRVEIRD